MRALRGATTVASDDGTLIREATAELLAAMLQRNDVDRDRIVSMWFTASHDLRAEFPAVAAREMGMNRVPLMCAAEIDVPGSLPRCVRVMMHCYMDAGRDPRHVYLRDAVRLRPDLASEADVQ
ncbi:MAG: chorismate mutase [Thermoleophilia bacterium]|nr:chorismate mutase [Thermoleophilia bacterium]